MKNLMSKAVVIKLYGAFAWFIYLAFLTKFLSGADLGKALYTLTLSGILAACITAGWSQWLLREGSQSETDLSTAWSVAVAGVAYRGLIAFPCVMFLTAQLGGKMYTPIPFLPVVIGLTTAALSYLMIASAGLRAAGQISAALLLPGPLRILLATFFTVMCGQNGLLTLEIALLIHLLVLLPLIALAIRKAPALMWRGNLPKARVTSLTLSHLGMTLFQNLDVLVIGFVLSPSEAAIYLIARRIAALLSVVYDGLRSAISPQIARSFRQSERKDFVALAARANLGFMLIGGGAAVFLLLAAEPLLTLFSVDITLAKPVFGWLLAAQTIPAIFGATGMLMMMTNLSALRAWVLWAGMPIAMMILFFSARADILSLAMAHAFTQGASAAIFAVILIHRQGVWPGPTALFHNQLKLR